MQRKLHVHGQLPLAVGSKTRVRQILLIVFSSLRANHEQDSRRVALQRLEPESRSCSGGGGTDERGRSGRVSAALRRTTQLRQQCRSRQQECHSTRQQERHSRRENLARAPMLLTTPLTSAERRPGRRRGQPQVRRAWRLLV